MTRCAVPSCKGQGRTRNDLGVCEVCLHPSSFDPTGYRMDTVWDADRELQQLLDELNEGPADVS